MDFILFYFIVFYFNIFFAKIFSMYSAMLSFHLRIKLVSLKCTYRQNYKHLSKSILICWRSLSGNILFYQISAFDISSSTFTLLVKLKVILRDPMNIIMYLWNCLTFLIHATVLFLLFQIQISANTVPTHTFCNELVILPSKEHDILLRIHMQCNLTISWFMVRNKV